MASLTYLVLYLRVRLLALPTNDRPDWKKIAEDKHSSLFGRFASYEEGKLYDIDTWDRFGPGQGAVRSLRVKDEERVG
jgi:hypothetical protein